MKDLIVKVISVRNGIHIFEDLVDGQAYLWVSSDESVFERDKEYYIVGKILTEGILGRVEVVKDNYDIVRKMRELETDYILG